MRRGRILIFLVLIVIVGLVVLALALNQFGGLVPGPVAATPGNLQTGLLCRAKYPSRNNNYTRHAGYFFSASGKCS